ncbi:Phosphoserine phosphatase 1 [Symmachiella macrocystis]|uniref:Phosphoserine phosphatase 1 n=1 Tax=Symmachiella macrocystis TaxID=2527985 RepID=A0A5C6BNN4_9PLAN|nr:histidine phosphatase family protein [Symmachiella macrocystis]TWU13292.1 Phosphoserine phosphatase 1 [Symmachiella macrocystis]
MSKSQAVLIRPGCTDFDQQNRIQGTLNIPLNQQGQVQVSRLADDLRDISLKRIYSAPCEPARETAESLSADLGVPVKELDSLANLNQGLWQGMVVDDIRRKHPKVFKQWQESPETICPPEGEEVTDAMVRVGKAIDKILKRDVNFAIIAPEPLASMIRWHVCGGKLHTVEPSDSCRDDCHWEILETNGKSEAPVESGPGTPAKPARAKSSN